MVHFSQYHSIRISLFIIPYLAFLNSFLPLEIAFMCTQVPPMKRAYSYNSEATPKHCHQPQTLYRPTSNPESQCSDACSSAFPRSPKGTCQCWRSFYTFNPGLMMASVVQKIKYCVMSQNNNKQTKPTKPTPPQKNLRKL